MGDRNRVVVQPRQQGKTFAVAMHANIAGLRRKVQIARRQLDLDDDSYRAILRRTTGHESSTACNVRELDLLLREFAKRGFAPKPARKLSQKAQVRMIHAVWADIRPLLKSDADQAAALRAFVKRQTGVDAPEFLDSVQANKVLEGLKAWRARLRKSEGSVEV